MQPGAVPRLKLSQPRAALFDAENADDGAALALAMTVDTWLNVLLINVLVATIISVTHRHATPALLKSNAAWPHHITGIVHLTT